MQSQKTYLSRGAKDEATRLTFEDIFDVAGAVEHTNNFNRVGEGAVEDDVAAKGEA